MSLTVREDSHIGEGCKKMLSEVNTLEGYFFSH